MCLRPPQNRQEQDAGARSGGRGQRFAGAFLSVSGGVLLSRVLGLIRDILFARVWGTGPALAGFVIAFTIPNMLRSLFGEGAFSAGFVPVLSHRREQDGRQAAFRAANRILSVLAVILTGVLAILLLISLAGGVLVTGGLAGEVFRLLPILAPYAWFVCMTAALGGILHVLRRFVAPALSSVILNAALIAAGATALWVNASPRTGILFAAWAVPAAGIVQLAVMAWACRRAGFRPRFVWEPRDSAVSETLRLVAPAAAGAGVLQLNVMVDRLLAGYLGPEATTSLYYSQRLVYLPVGLFGVALGVVTLPFLSRAAASGDESAVRLRLIGSLRMAFFLAIPAAAVLAILGPDVIRLLFQRGRFTDAGVRATAWALAFYLPGIPAFVAAKVAVTPFHARKNTTTPVRISAALLLLNIVLNLILMQFLAQGGLALATTICSWLNVGILLSLYTRRHGSIGTRELWSAGARILLAGGVCAAGCQIARNLLVSCIPAAWPVLIQRTALVVLPAAVGAAGYLIAAVLLRLREIDELLSVLRRRESPRAGEE